MECGLQRKHDGDYNGRAFTGPFAVEAMAGGSGAQTWLNSRWTAITGGDFGTTVDYCGDSIRTQVLPVVSGNWWEP